MAAAALLFLWELFPACSGLHAATLQVPDSFPTLQSAISAASSGDIVEVAPGTYTGDGNRDLVLGATPVTVRSSAGAASTVLDLEGSVFDPHQAFRVEALVTPSTRIEGFTFRNGFAPGVGSDQKGGAIYLSDGASPTIADCVFESNRAARGGGIYCIDGASPMVVDCVFRENVVTLNGGAISVQAMSAPTVLRCVVVDNLSEKHAGGLGFLEFSDATVSDCVIAGNEALSLGGGIFVDRSSPQFTGLVVTGNLADQGGGVYVARSSNPPFLSTTVAANRSLREGGGVLVMNEGAVSFGWSIVWGNCAGAGGAAVHLGNAESRAAFDCTVLDVTGLAGAGEFDLVDIVAEDPAFCDPAGCATAPTSAGEFSLDAMSPAAGDFSPCGQQLGALGVACGVTPVHETTWGRLKARHAVPLEH